jgi:hypothetical protein
MWESAKRPPLINRERIPPSSILLQILHEAPKRLVRFQLQNRVILRGIGQRFSWQRVLAPVKCFLQMNLCLGAGWPKDVNPL